MQIQTNEQNLWVKKSIVMSQNNSPWPYHIFNERNKLVRNRRHLTPTSERFNIKHDHDNAISINNTSTHPNLMNNNQHDKPKLENVCRTKSGRVVEKPKRYIEEMWYNLFSISGHIINKEARNWRNVIWFIWQSDILKKCDFMWPL